MAFGLVRESSEGLEAHLALEDIQLAQQREELARSWASLNAAVETRFTNEVREGAIRDAAELLVPLKEERDVAVELLREATAEREAMEGSLAQKRRELGQLETQLLSAHQAAGNPGGGPQGPCRA